MPFLICLIRTNYPKLSETPRVASMLVIIQQLCITLERRDGLKGSDRVAECKYLAHEAL